MRQRRQNGRLIFLGLGLVMALFLAMPAGVAADTTPGNTVPKPVAVGASVVFAGNGFTPNESLSIYETQPGQDPIPQGGVQSDQNGGFTTTISFPATGVWQATAYGISSGKTFVLNYAVGTTSNVTNAAPATSVSGAPSSTAPQVGIGAPVAFTGNGFTANETIATWETPPGGGAPTALPNLQADNTGAFTTSFSFPSVGQWQVTAHGVTSGHEIIGRYTVTDTSGSATTPSSPASTFTSPYTGVPVKATAGTIVTYTATGFNAGETVVAWVTPPDSTTAVTPLDSVTASSAGRATISTSFGSAGLWQITLHGRDSGHEIVGKYQVTAS